MNELVVSSNAQLNERLNQFKHEIQELALQNLQEAASSGSYTGPQLLAMMRFEQLKLVEGLDLAALLIRAELIEEIEDKNLYAVHPQGFSSLEEAMDYYHISRSKLSDIRTWRRVIFPYFDRRKFSIPQIYDEIGVSNLREATPLLKAVITGEEPDRGSVREALDRVYADIDQTAEQSGKELTPEQRRDLAVDWILSHAQATTQDFRKAIRPGHTPNIEGLIMRRNGTCYLLAQMDADQETMLQRLMGKHLDLVYVDLEREPVGSVGLVKQLLGGQNGLRS